MASTVSVEPKVFDVLLHLIAMRDRVVSKDQLVEAVWQGRIISDAAISSAVSAARRALGDDGHAQRYIRTMHGRGFRFVSPLVEVGSSESKGMGGASDARHRSAAQLQADRRGGELHPHRRTRRPDPIGRFGTDAASGGARWSSPFRAWQGRHRAADVPGPLPPPAGARASVCKRRDRRLASRGPAVSRCRGGRGGGRGGVGIARRRTRLCRTGRRLR